MRLSFHGGARDVTGACYLLETSQAKILVDCGLFQGCDECADLNFESFRFDPASIDLVLVTHAHLDHVGRLPKLVQEGFSGKICSTAPTRELAFLILEDALALAERKNQKLYAQEDLAKTFNQWEDIPYHKITEFKDLKFKFDEAGHILGSSFIELWIDPVRSQSRRDIRTADLHPARGDTSNGARADQTSNGAGEKHLLFTGDIGNIPSVLLRPPERFKDIEYLIIESTYGNRTHESSEERVLALERAVEETAARKGTLLIPAFATERTQDILFLLNEMLLFKRIPEMPVFVDSPLAIRITDVFEKYLEEYKEEIRQLFREHPGLFKFKKLKFTPTVEESKSINEVPPPKVVIAGSGMMQGGRILHHARRYLSDPKSTLLVTGYQAAGSLGRRLLDKEKAVKLFGEDILVQAKIKKINGFSAHADNPQLYSFVESNRDFLKHVFVVQGEEAQSLHFRQEIKDRLGVMADAPSLYEKFEL